MKKWHIVVFNLDQQPPGIEPQMFFALDEVTPTYLKLGQPRGFAVFWKPFLEEQKFAFWFSPDAAVYYAAYIAANSGVLWDGPPADAACIGDEATRFIL